jgi:hypothetical protein
MKYFLSICFLSFCFTTVQAQEKHFVFIQSENSQPFYVSINGKLHSSTAAGYVIIPKLADGDYNCSVGFAQNAFPEQTFQFTIDKKDLGFNLKNFGEKGWGLFNLQSLSVTMAGTSSSNDVAKALQEAERAKDNSEPVISFEKKKKDSVAVAGQTIASAETVASQAESTAGKKTNADAAVALSKSAETASESGSKSDVTKVSEVKESDGVRLSYVDKSGKVTDTVQITIPSSKTKSEPAPNATSADTNSSSNNNVATTSNSSTPAAASKDKDDFKFLDVDMNSAQKETAGSGSKQATAPVALHVTGNCKNIATDDDYNRLRKKMAMETSDEKMINEAKKTYRNKCFTTSQVKGLSTLFMSDEGRYNFFNASLPSVVDASQYSSLQSEFIDPAYVNRFKAMLQ